MRKSKKQLEKEELFKLITTNASLKEAIFSGVSTVEVKKRGILSESKIYMIPWEASLKEYNKCVGEHNKKLKPNNRKEKLSSVSYYIEFQHLLNPETFIQKLYRRAILHYIETKKADFVYNGSIDDIADSFLNKVFHKLRDAQDEPLKYMSRELPCVRGDVGIELHDSLNFVTFLKRKGYTIDLNITDIVNEIKHILDDTSETSKIIQVTEDDDSNMRVMLRSDYETLFEVKSLIHELMSNNSIKLYTGLGGTGKSFDAIKYAKEKSLIGWHCITLSNTVALKLCTDAKMRDFDCIPMSIAKYRYTRKQYLMNIKYVIIDEFSQWSLHELNIFRSIIYNVLKNNGQLILLGDTNQIHSFLGRGCLLHAVQLLLDGTPYYEHKVEIKRQTNIALKNSICGYVMSHDITAFNAFRIHNEEDFEPKTTMVVTGSNDHVERLNLLALKLIMQESEINYPPLEYIYGVKGCRTFKYFHNGVEKNNYNELRDIKLEIIDKLLSHNIDVRLISAETWTFDDDNYKKYNDIKAFDFRVLRNDKAYILSKENGVYNIRLNRKGTLTEDIEFTIACSDLLDYFNFGYAITVNSAQGLDWRKTIVNMDFTQHPKNDFNAHNFEAFYVAATRGKDNTSFYILTDNQDSTIFEPLVVKNHFNIKKYTSKS